MQKEKFIVGKMNKGQKIIIVLLVLVLLWLVVVTWFILDHKSTLELHEFWIREALQNI